MRVRKLILGYSCLVVPRQGRWKQFTIGPALPRVPLPPGAVRAKDAAARGVWGHAPPGNFRRSEIDSDAFWDAFPAWQGTRKN